MSRIVIHPQPSFWEQICQEFEEKRRKIDNFDSEKDSPDTVDFDVRKHHPIFHGQAFAQVESDYYLQNELNPAIGHPACAGLWMQDEKVSREAKAENSRPTPPDKKTCSNLEFLEYYVWPYILPALEATLIQARLEGCIKSIMRMSFNSLDFLMLGIYNNNPMHPERKDNPEQFDDISFVKAFHEIHPKPPVPASLMWTADETAGKIQAAFRGFIARRDPEVQELRRWQREWRVLNKEDHIFEEVLAFWERQMPNGSSSNTSTTQSGISFRPHSRQRNYLALSNASMARPSSVGPYAMSIFDIFVAHNNENAA